MLEVKTRPITLVRGAPDSENGSSACPRASTNALKSTADFTPNPLNKIALLLCNKLLINSLFCITHSVTAVPSFSSATSDGTNTSGNGTPAKVFCSGTRLHHSSDLNSHCAARYGPRPIDEANLCTNRLRSHKQFEFFYQKDTMVTQI